jgi:hypothetical protein
METLLSMSLINMTLEDKIICLRQVNQKSLYIDMSKEGHGDCRYCKPDEYNKNCSGYYPIHLKMIIIEPKTTRQS